MAEIPDIKNLAVLFLQALSMPLKAATGAIVRDCEEESAGCVPIYATRTRQ
jgi:hypothetical protein